MAQASEKKILVVDDEEDMLALPFEAIERFARAGRLKDDDLRPSLRARVVDELRRLAARLVGRRLLAVAAEPGASLALLPEESRRAYDVHPLVDAVLDQGSTLELHPRWAPRCGWDTG